MDQSPQLQLLTTETEKTTVNRLGDWFARNILRLVGFLIPVLVIGSVFFDLKLVGGVRIWRNGVFLVLMILLGERVTLKQGSDAGRMDARLIRTEASYNELLARVMAAGISRLDAFCVKIMDEELPIARADLIHSYGIDEALYNEQLSTWSSVKLISRYGFRRGLGIFRIRSMRPILLSPSMLLSETTGRYQRRRVMPSGDDLVDSSMFSLKSILIGVFLAVVVVAIFPLLRDGVSLDDVAYMCTCLVCLLFRMGTGYAKGYHAQAVGQRKSLDSKIYFLTQYLEYLAAGELVGPIEDEAEK